MESTTHAASPHHDVLVIGASRGLGEAIVETYVERGAHVVGTVRGERRAPLHEYADRAGGAVELEQVDITDRAAIDALARRLADRRFDLLFVVAGTSLATADAVAADISDEDFARVMATNALGPLRVVAALQHLVTETGTIAVMSSGQGSVANNTAGGREVYRASKAALNQLFRSYAARHRDGRRPLLLLAPGWIKTALGGPDAPYEIGTSIPPLVDTVDAQHGTPGLQYLDRFGRAVAW